ncbi:MAG: lipopolysaccharide heptosyltransferase II [Burkholderiaceae bacterium]
MRTLIVAPNWIGDAVMAQPLLAWIRQRDPQGTIDVMAPPHVAPAFSAMAEVCQVIIARNVHGKLELGRRWKLARELRRARYDRCYVLPNSMKSALVPWLAGIGQRIGYRGEGRRILLNRMHDEPAGAERPPMVEFYAKLALDPAEPMPTNVANPVLMRQRTREAVTLARFGIGVHEPLIVLCPGAEFGPAKRWPTRHFAALAAMVNADWPEASIVLLGSSKERPLATEIAALSGQTLKNLCGETTLDEALHLIARASGVVSNDSGMMHVAAAYERPQVAVFGSSDPRHTPPRSPHARIEWLHLECSPCFQRQCPLKHTNCLNDIAPSDVFDALRKAMRFETSRPPR